MKPGYIVTVCILLFAGFSCSKNSVNGGPKLWRVLSSGEVRQEFTYDEQGRLVKWVNYLMPGVTGSESTRHYDNEGRLVKTEDAFNVSSSMSTVQMDRSYSEMSYDNANKLKETRVFNLRNGSYQYVSRRVYDYDPNGRIIAVNLSSPTDPYTTKTTYQYNPDNNVLIEEFFQYNQIVQGKIYHREYEYDNGLNPYRDIWVMPYGANQNNITKIIGTNYALVQGMTSGTGTNVITIKKYNSQGYPTLTNESGADFTYEYR
jgi:hypothetical protein